MFNDARVNLQIVPCSFKNYCPLQSGDFFTHWKTSLEHFFFSTKLQLSFEYLTFFIAFGHQNMNFPCIWSYNQFRRHSGGNRDFCGKRHACKISTNQPLQNLKYSIDSCSFVEKKKCSNDVFSYLKKSPDCSGQYF